MVGTWGWETWDALRLRVKHEGLGGPGGIGGSLQDMVALVLVRTP